LAVDLIEETHRVSLLAERCPRVIAFWNYDGDVVPKEGELICEVVDVNGAVCSEIVVEHQENVAHLLRAML
jgi:hypothetical protein